MTPGPILPRLEETFERALRSGALEPIATRESVIEERGVRFLVRILERRERKEQSQRAQETSGRNPFLPYEEELFVADVSTTHVAILNKFNVLSHHFLVVTRAFEEQESLLTLADFEAVHTVLADLDFLAFYNAGPLAGASQRHKHLQFVPPLGPGKLRCPMEAIRFEDLPFPARFEAPLPPSASAVHELYLRWLESSGRLQEPRAYNLLLTRDWMLAVARRRHQFDGLSVNALGFAGAFLVGDDSELERLRSVGPFRVLQEVSE